MSLTIKEAVEQHGLEYLRGKAVRYGGGYVLRFYGTFTPNDKFRNFAWITENAEVLESLPCANPERIQLLESIIGELRNFGDVFSDAQEVQGSVTRAKTLIALADQLAQPSVSPLCEGRLFADGDDVGPASCHVDGLLSITLDTPVIDAVGRNYQYSPVGSSERWPVVYFANGENPLDAQLVVTDRALLRRFAERSLVSAEIASTAVRSFDNSPEPN